jgi:hypothetical protein
MEMVAPPGAGLPTLYLRPRPAHLGNGVIHTQSKDLVTAFFQPE